MSKMSRNQRILCISAKITNYFGRNSKFVKKGHFSVPYFTWVRMNRRVWSLIWWTSGFICPKINCKLNERIFIFTQNEKNCISPNVDVNPYFPQLSHPLESLSISLFNQKLPSKNHKLKYFKMKLSLIFLAATAAEQTTTWEPTTTTMFTTKADDWCGRHHDTLESFTQQVCLRNFWYRYH